MKCATSKWQVLWEEEVLLECTAMARALVLWRHKVLKNSYEIFIPICYKTLMPTNKWSNEVTKKSDALDLEKGIFTFDDPKRIAQSLKNSAEELRILFGEN